MNDARTLYLELVKRCLLGEMGNPRTRPAPILSAVDGEQMLREADVHFAPYLRPVGHTVESFMKERQGLDLTGAHVAEFFNGMHPDLTPDTMSEAPVLENLQACVEDVLRQGVPGDLIETGAWKGGLTVLMRAVLEAHGDARRRVWVADSFEGLPEPDPRVQLDDAIWWYMAGPLERLRIPIEEARATFTRYGLLDERVVFLKGWFADTLPNASMDALSVLRLDGDWYDSTKVALEALYPKLSVGGYVIIDDYGVPVGCRQAVDEYRSQHDIREPVEWVNYHAVFWRKVGPRAGA